MSDIVIEQQTPEQARAARAPIETASHIMPSPEHPTYSADKAVARSLAGGRSGVIAAIDGIGSGGEKSSKAAEIMLQNLNAIESRVMVPPTINQGAALLRDAIMNSSEQINTLQRSSGDNQADTTASSGIVCESTDGKKRFLVTANVGDSRIYKYEPGTGEVSQLTTDHTTVQSLIDAGIISKDEAFTHPTRNVIYRSVGDVKTPDLIGFQVTEIQEGDMFLAVSDGLSDNIAPDSLPAAVQSEFHAGWDSAQNKIDLKKFATGLAQRARNIQESPTAVQAKPDDICVSVLRAPRKLD